MTTINRIKESIRNLFFSKEVRENDQLAADNLATLGKHLVGATVLASALCDSYNLSQVYSSELARTNVQAVLRTSLLDLTDRLSAVISCIEGGAAVSLGEPGGAGCNIQPVNQPLEKAVSYCSDLTRAAIELGTDIYNDEDVWSRVVALKHVRHTIIAYLAAK